MSAAPTRSVATVAPAKLNLYLHLLGRRDDGYHRLDSLVVFAGVGDTLAATGAADFSLSVSGPFKAAAPGGDDNLVARAARALAAAAKRPAGTRLRLIKRLPVAAGIGGGSADAAAALRILSRLWRVRGRDAVCSRLAPGLGADVPVCLNGRPSFVGGVGERLSPAPSLPSLWAVLVNPGVPVSTPAVFAAFARSGAPFGRASRFRRAPADALEFAQMLRARGNDLGPPALDLAPPIGRALAALAAQPAALLARMSGSGGTCFALFEREHHARSSARTIRRAEPAWWVAAAPILQKATPLA